MADRYFGREIAQNYSGQNPVVQTQFFAVASPRGKSALAVVVIQSYCLVMLDWSKCAAVERIAGKVSGAWLFKGTRVPVAALFENLEDGATVDDFLEWFPGVAREQVEAVLEHAGQSLAIA